MKTLSVNVINVNFTHAKQKYNTKYKIKYFVQLHKAIFLSH